MRQQPALTATSFILLASSWLFAVDKNGVSPQAISLPSGPGSIQGLGESFQPQLNTGSASYAIPLALPTGTAGHAPALTLSYDSGAANGCLGLGWTLSGAVSVTRNTDAGVPRYVDAANGADDDGDGIIDNPQELDVYSGMDREELVPLADGSFRAESEAAFTRYERSGAGWVARRRDGKRYDLGTTAQSRVEDAGRVFAWLIDRVTDTDGNTITFEYVSDAASPGQKYLRRIRWGQPNASLIAVVTYAAGRPDVQVDFRSGFEVRTALRAVRIDVVSQGIPARPDAVRGDLDGDGTQDALIRRWVLEYHATAPVSLLSRVTQLGCDGATALPSVALDYTQWTPPASIAALVVQSLGEPAETLSSGSVELCDMNGDGLPDLLSTSANQHRVAVNLGMTPEGRLEWAPAVPVGNAPTVDIASSAAHLADATADGLSDLVVKVSNTRFLCFDNTSQNAWTAAAAPLTNTDTWPIWPFDGASGASSRSIDTDHNRRNDVLFTSNSGYGLWSLLPQGQYAREVRIAPLQCEGQTFRFDLLGAHIADLNGDRLQDLVWVQASRVVWFPNQGRDRFGACQILPLGVTLTSADIEKTGFCDIDGDGLEDLTLVRPSTAPRGIVYWLNRFQVGLDGPRQLDGLPALVAGDALRWADMNGNGSADIVISNSARPAGSRLQVVELLPEGKPYVLSRAANGMGLVMSLEHESSVDQMVRARRNGTPWSAVMQISVPVVRRLIEDDSRGNVNVREITYRDPFWEPHKQEFRGFRDVQLREVGDDSATDRITRHRFDPGIDADCLKGKQILDEVLDETGKVFLRNETLWDPRVLAVGNDDRQVCFAFAASIDTTHIEGIEEAIATRVEKEYDDFGNVTVDRNLGIADVPGDEVVVMNEYEVRPDVWIIDRLARKTTFDGAGKKLAEERYIHDARGNLIRREVWLDTEDRFIVALRQSYDSFGNVIESLDAHGHRRTIEFDSLLHAFAVAERFHLESTVLEMTADYDLGLGVVTGATDFNGAQHSFVYDALGRVLRLQHPEGARVDIEYQLAAPVSRVIERTLETAGGGTFDAFTYFDGYGRPLGKKAEAEGGKWRFLEAKRYNSRKLPGRSWLPLVTADPEYAEPLPGDRHEAYSYDAMGRVTAVVHPDGSSTRNEYAPLAVIQHDENDTAGRLTPRTVHRDGLERIVRVVEQNGAQLHTSSYRWDALGDLTEIEDAQGNLKTMAYDSLRRLIEMQDPDRGAKRYTYDDGNNLIRAVDAKGQTIEYEYDFAHRIAAELHRGGAAGEDREVAYRYDSPAGELDLGNGERETAELTRGRLASVIDPSGETHFSYDARGNKVWVLNRIREPSSGLLVGYLTRFSHDLLDRVVQLVYPDGDRLRTTYNEGNTVERIDGGPGGIGLVDAADQHSSGQVARRLLANGVETVSTFDARDRLATLVTVAADGSRLIDNEYRYDPASNLLRVMDRRPFAQVERTSPRRNTQVFSYDDLDRLTRVRYAQPDDLDANLGQIDYAYDAIGNLVAKSTPAAGQPGHLSSPDLTLGAIVYGGGQASGRAQRLPGDPPGPHAATRTASGRAFEYDANGNMTRRDGALLTWDAKDQITGYQHGSTSAVYVYDYADRRVAKAVTRDGRRTDETIYVNQYYEERPGRTPVKMVFDGATRIARVEGSIDPAADKLQRLRLASGWNAVTAVVTTGKTLAQAFGADAAVYTWRSGAYEAVPASSNLQAGQPLWVHAPTSRLIVLKGPLAPAAGPVPVPPGGALLAWPSLQAFSPAAHLSQPARVFVHDADTRRWLVQDPELPRFLQDFDAALPSAGAMWIAAPPGTLLLPPAQASQKVQFYSSDHLGSASVVTDQGGSLVEEIAYYPFGQVRNRHTTAPASAPAEYGFTGKETDGESGLIYLGARYCDPVLGRFASVDPLLGNPAALEPAKLTNMLEDPQMLGLYSYVLNNPVRFFDPDGLDARPSRLTIQRTVEEAKAFDDYNVNIFGEALFRKPVPRQVVSFNNPRTGQWVDVPPGRSAESFRSGWRQVTAEFQLKDPDGNPVRNHYVSIRFQGKDGVSINNVRTDNRGVVKFVTDVPARKGTIEIEAAFDQDSKVKIANTRTTANFTRQSGQDALKFEGQLRDWELETGGRKFEGTEVEVKQTK